MHLLCLARILQFDYSTYAAQIVILYIIQWKYFDLNHLFSENFFVCQKNTYGPLMPKRNFYFFYTHIVVLLLRIPTNNFAVAVPYGFVSGFVGLVSFTYRFTYLTSYTTYQPDFLCFVICFSTMKVAGPHVIYIYAMWKKILANSKT